MTSQIELPPGTPPWFAWLVGKTEGATKTRLLISMLVIGASAVVMVLLVSFQADHAVRTIYANKCPFEAEGWICSLPTNPIQGTATCARNQSAFGPMGDAKLRPDLVPIGALPGSKPQDDAPPMVWNAEPQPTFRLFHLDVRIVRTKGYDSGLNESDILKWVRETNTAFDGSGVRFDANVTETRPTPYDIQFLLENPSTRKSVPLSFGKRDGRILILVFAYEKNETYAGRNFAQKDYSIVRADWRGFHVFAHELGHEFCLGHVQSTENLMAEKGGTGDWLTQDQLQTMRECRP